MKKLINTLGENQALKQILRKMKLSITFLLIGFITVSASSYSQSTKLDVSFKNNSITELFREIEEQSEFYFFFQKEEQKTVLKIS